MPAIEIILTFIVLLQLIVLLRILIRLKKILRVLMLTASQVGVSGKDLIEYGGK